MKFEAKHPKNSQYELVLLFKGLMFRLTYTHILFVGTAHFETRTHGVGFPTTCLSISQHGRIKPAKFKMENMLIRFTLDLEKLLFFI